MDLQLSIFLSVALLHYSRNNLIPWDHPWTPQANLIFEQHSARQVSEQAVWEAAAVASRFCLMDYWSPPPSPVPAGSPKKSIPY